MPDQIGWTGMKDGKMLDKPEPLYRKETLPMTGPDIAALLAYIEALKVVMREYGRHDDGCASHDLERDRPGEKYRQKKCTCGLNARLAELGLKSQR